MGYGYALDALTIDTVGGTVTLRPDYDFTRDRVDIAITDDDQIFDGDTFADELGEDATQTAIVRDLQGNLLASGQVYDEAFHAITDGVTTIWVEVVEIDGQVVGYLVSEPLEPGTVYTISTTAEVEVGSTITYDQICSVPCFGPGTHIMTTEGEVPADWLAPGDRVITRDSGAQPVLWVGRYRVTPPQAQNDPSLTPFRIEAGALGPGQPSHPTQLSPQHRVLLSGYDIELHAGTDEAFAAVQHLEDGGLFERHWPGHDFVYTHVLLEQHEIILANGLWVESLFLGAQVSPELLRKLPATLAARPEVIAGHRHAARLCLKKHEVAAVLGYHAGAALPDLLRAVG